MRHLSTSTNSSTIRVVYITIRYWYDKGNKGQYSWCFIFVPVSEHMMVMMIPLGETLCHFVCKTWIILYLLHAFFNSFLMENMKLLGVGINTYCIVALTLLKAFFIPQIYSRLSCINEKKHTSVCFFASPITHMMYLTKEYTNMEKLKIFIIFNIWLLKEQFGNWHFFLCFWR